MKRKGIVAADTAAATVGTEVATEGIERRTNITESHTGMTVEEEGVVRNRTLPNPPPLHRLLPIHVPDRDPGHTNAILHALDPTIVATRRNRTSIIVGTVAMGAGMESTVAAEVAAVVAMIMMMITTAHHPINPINSPSFRMWRKRVPLWNGWNGVERRDRLM